MYALPLYVFEGLLPRRKTVLHDLPHRSTALMGIVMTGTLTGAAYVSL
jgi:hypothetical protein